MMAGGHDQGCGTVTAMVQIAGRGDNPARRGLSGQGAEPDADSESGSTVKFKLEPAGPRRWPGGPGPATGTGTQAGSASRLREL